MMKVLRGFICFLQVLLYTICFSQNKDSIVTVSITREGLTNITVGGHVAFPSITRLQNDSLMVIYRKGNTHVDMSGKIMKQFGSPDGLFWTPPVVLYDDPSYDDRDPSIQTLENGNVVLNYFKYNLGNNFSNPPVPAFFSVFFSTSNDNGQTFTTPVSVDDTHLSLPATATYNGTRYLSQTGNNLESYATSAPIIESDGKLILPAYGGETLVYQSSTGCYPTNKQRIVFFESEDEGTSWTKRIINENDQPNTWLTEPVITKLQNGEMLLQMRTSDNPCTPGGYGPMRQSVSNSNGDTFSEFNPFGFVGHAPSLYQLTNGVILSGFRWYNNAMNMQKTAFMYSIDNGVTWSDTIVVSNCNGECGYPSFVELAEDKFMIVYYAAYGQAISAVTYTISIGVDNSQNPEIVGLPIEFNPGRDFIVFPNPSNGNFSVSLDNMKEGNTGLRIFDYSGKVLHTEEYFQSDKTLNRSFQFEDLTPGVYFFEVTSDNNSFTKKIIIR